MFPFHTDIAPVSPPCTPNHQQRQSVTTQEEGAASHWEFMICRGKHLRHQDACFYNSGRREWAHTYLNHPVRAPAPSLSAPHFFCANRRGRHAISQAAAS